MKMSSFHAPGFSYTKKNVELLVCYLCFWLSLQQILHPLPKK